MPRWPGEVPLAIVKCSAKKWGEGGVSEAWNWVGCVRQVI
jgi:hypothetical protein